ncbi:MAG TPA: hypothetical protein VIK81_04205 [Patescibacteria group bacterium]
MPAFKKKSYEEKEKKKDTSKEEIEAAHAKIKSSNALLFWKSPSRIFKKRRRKYFTTIAAIALVLMALATVAGEFLLVAVILAMVFVSYALAVVEPEEVDHKITPFGLVSGQHAYLWDELKSFWFVKKDENELLNIETNLRFPGRLIILLGGVEKNAVRELLSRHIAFREIPIVTWIDKAALKLSSWIPLED